MTHDLADLLDRTAQAMHVEAITPTEQQRILSDWYDTLNQPSDDYDQPADIEYTSRPVYLVSRPCPIVIDGRRRLVMRTFYTTRPLSTDHTITNTNTESSIQP